VSRKRRSPDEDLSEDSFDSYRPASIRILVYGGVVAMVVIALLILIASWALSQPGMEHLR
jgi:Ni/Fe-hydrogenase subunit HybB-like protein